MPAATAAQARAKIVSGGCWAITGTASRRAKAHCKREADNVLESARHVLTEGQSQLGLLEPRFALVAAEPGRATAPSRRCAGRGPFADGTHCAPRRGATISLDQRGGARLGRRTQ